MNCNGDCVKMPATIFAMLDDQIKGRLETAMCNGTALIVKAASHEEALELEMLVRLYGGTSSTVKLM